MAFQPILFSGFTTGSGSGGGGSSPTIGGPVVGGTAGSVLFVGAGSTLTQDNANFNFNDSTHTLTITGNIAAATFNGFTPENSANKGIANGYAPLDGAGKVPYVNLPSSLMTFKGAWNPTTNTPTLTNGTGLTGDTYRASVGGTSTSPISDTWFAGDFIIYNGTIWQRSPLADGVISVNGLSGAVVLTQGNLTDVGTDGITITNGTNAVWGSGTSIAQHVADSTHNGYLSSTDWSTFNTGATTASNAANKALSNLASVAINTALLPTSSATIDLGSTSLNFRDGYIRTLKDSSGFVSLSINNRSLNDSAGTASISWATAGKISFLPGISLTLDGATSGAISLNPNAVTTNYSLFLPAAQGASNTFLKNDGSGNLTWATVSGGTVTAVTASAPLSSSGGSTPNITISQSNTTTDGYLSSTDWNTFNNKQPSGSYITALTGDVTASGPGSAPATISATTVTGKVLTGFVSGPNSTVLSTDTVLQGLEKLQAQVSAAPVASTGDLNQGSFTAADNQSTPADVTGFAFANGSVRSFDALVSVTRSSTYQAYKITGIQKAASWEMSQDFTGDDTGLVFSITAAGQVQYVSTSTGSTALVKYRAIVTNV